jgi:hypothetical protein
MTEKTKETLGLQSFHYENVARATYTNLIIRKKKHAGSTTEKATGGAKSAAEKTKEVSAL